MYVFGKTSKEKLSTCDIKLQQVLELALSYGIVDFSVICGHRTLEEQQDAFKKGNSKIDGITNKSRHQTIPSQAVDVIPYPCDWNDKESFYKLATVIFKASNELGVKLNWGGHWKSLQDMPHFELKRRD